MAAAGTQGLEQVRSAELMAALCLATDLAMELPFEHGLHSTLFAMRLAERLNVDEPTRIQTYYGCLLFYAGCTADSELTSELFGEGALLTHFTPVMFGTPLQTVAGIARALGNPDSGTTMRAMQAVRKLPRAARGHRRHVAALCEVAQMLSERLGMPPAISGLFAHLTERWDGKGPERLTQDQIPLPLRIIHVARDAAFQQLLGGTGRAAAVVRQRSGGAFDPVVAQALVDGADEILALEEHQGSVWDATLAAEPHPTKVVEGHAVDDALAAMGDFADLVSPYLVGHSAAVARLAADAATRCGLAPAEVTAVRRSSLVHDIGRVAVPSRIWQKPGRLTPDEWERVRLHAYHSERILCHSRFLAALAPVATAHHERLDGGGYHRGIPAPGLPAAARLLAAADACAGMMHARPHRAALTGQQMAQALQQECAAGALDPEAVAAVLAAAGQRPPRLERPGGLTEREAQVVALLARGLQTKQVARILGISAKTADHHVQNAYAKIGVSTRAAAAVFAMQHGLTSWGELPMGSDAPRS